MKPLEPKVIDEKVARIKNLVEEYNKGHEKKLEYVEETREPTSRQAVVALAYNFGRRRILFVGCRTMPEMAVENLGKDNVVQEFMDEFLETLA